MQKNELFCNAMVDAEETCLNCGSAPAPVRLTSPLGLAFWFALKNQSRDYLAVCSEDCAYRLGLSMGERMRREGERH